MDDSALPTWFAQRLWLVLSGERPVWRLPPYALPNRGDSAEPVSVSNLKMSRAGGKWLKKH